MAEKNVIAAKGNLGVPDHPLDYVPTDDDAPSRVLVLCLLQMAWNTSDYRHRGEYTDYPGSERCDLARQLGDRLRLDESTAREAMEAAMVEGVHKGYLKPLPSKHGHRRWLLTPRAIEGKRLQDA